MRRLLFAAALGVLLWAMLVVPLPLAALAPVPATPVAVLLDRDRDLSLLQGIVPPGIDEEQFVELAIRRDREERTERVALAPLAQTGQVGIGVAVTTVNLEIDLPVEVEAAADTRIGGPSAGLMIALAVHDAATEGSLTGGLTVAGTGTIDVGPALT